MYLRNSWDKSSILDQYFFSFYT